MNMHLILLCMAVAATEPAAEPTTRQVASSPVPQADSPQAFQRAYRDSVNSQDADAVRAMFLIRSPGERAMVDVLVENELDAARLASAAEAAFGIKLVGGGTLVPPTETDLWVVEDDVANIPVRGGRNPHCVPLRKVDGVYKIDLRAWGMDWLDNPDAAEARQRLRPDPDRINRILTVLADGRYRTVEEFCGADGDRGFLAIAPDSPPAKAPRPFRRPVKVDLSTPLAVRRTLLIATAEGDSDAFLRCMQIVDPTDEAGLKAMARHISSSASLQEAASQKFDLRGGWFGIPASAHPDLRGDALQELAALDDLEQGPRLPDEEFPLVINGDEAQWKDLGDAVAEMVRINGEWKICSRLKEEIGQRDEDANDWVKIYNLLAQFEEEFASRIMAGEFKSAQDAQAAMERAVEVPPAEPAPPRRP